MYPVNQNYNHIAVPPLYPMDPCRPMAMPEPMPQSMPQFMPEPMPQSMPMCPMMNPQFRECVQVCMMQCGNYPTPYEYPMDINGLNPYYPENI